MARLACGLALGLALAGCTWAPLRPAGEGVRLLRTEPTGCEIVGNATARTRAQLGPFRRNLAKVRGELETLARNEAGAMGGNAVWPLGPPDAGEQRFQVLRCP